MADAQFQIDIATASAGVVSAAATLDRLVESLSAAGAASSAAAAAVAAGEASYAELEVGAAKAVASSERLGAALDAHRAKMAAAMAAGNEGAFWKLAPKMDELAAKQAEAAAAAQTAAAALAAEATSLDGLRSAASAAASAEETLTQEIQDANKALKEAEKAQQAAIKAAPTGKVNELAEGFGKMGGPVGMAGTQIFGLVDGLKKFAGAAGPTLTAIAAGAAAFALLAVAAFGAGVAIVGILKKTVAFADKEKRLEAATKRLDKNLEETFGGLRIDGLLDGMDTLVNLFDANTASGRAMKFLFETMFQPLVDGITAAIPLVERVFIIAMIWAMKAYIALKPYSAEIASVAKWLAIAAGVIVGVVVVSIALFIAFIGAAIAIIVAIVAAIAYLITWLVGALPAAWEAVAGAAGAAWDAVSEAVSSAIDWITGVDLASVGVDLIMGLVNGITSAAGAVVSAVTGAVGGAIDAAKGMLGIASPSKVFAELGGQTAAGFAGGVEGGAADSQDALASLVDPPDVGGALGKMREPAERGGRGATVGGGRGGGNVTIEQLHVHAATGEPQDIRAAVKDALTEVLEGDALQFGGGEVAA